jgi:hypothetical protein
VNAVEKDGSAIVAKEGDEEEGDSTLGAIEEKDEEGEKEVKEKEKENDMEGIEGVEDGDVPLEGSSRVTGGVLRGRAVGNVFNLADSDMLVDRVVPVKGIVRVYSNRSHHPLYHKPTMTMTTETKPSLGPVLQRLAKKYSPVTSKCLHACLCPTLHC